MNNQKQLRFDGKVVIVTGAGGGLGKAYALLFASRGAKVVVNDLGGSAHGEGASTRAADLVVKEIKDAGGTAVANYDSVENGEAIVKTAIDNFGRVDIVINNAGILRDKSFMKMTDTDWDLIFKVHVKGSYSVTRAAWNYMREQKFGRIIMTASAAGLYGNFGQANYAAAKMALVGLSNTLAIEGAKSNIHCNTIAPLAGSRLTETVFPPDVVAALKPEFVAPLVAYLCHEDTKENGGLFEVGAGWVSKLRWQRTKGAFMPINTPPSIEDIRDNWSVITDWTAATNPKATQESFSTIFQNLNNRGTKKPTGNANVDVEKVMKHYFEPSEYSFTQRDVAMYALSIGAARDPLNPSELKFVYENSPDFCTLPFMGVIFPSYVLTQILSINGLKFDPMMLLHGEHFMELFRPLPTSGTVVNNARVKHLYDKGKGALLIVDVITSDKASGQQLCRNEFSLFIRGIGGFGGERGPSDTNANQPPQRPADYTHTETTSENQALFYRLNGDYNPLHADPSMAGSVGFKKPILHGLCSFGYACRAVLAKYCDNDVSRFKSVRVRFAKHVFPGETIETQMWKVSDTKVVFQCRVKERNEIVLSNAVVEIIPSSSSTTASSSQSTAAESGSGISIPGFKASEIFAAIEKRVAAEGAALVPKINGVIQFDITADTTKTVQSWTVDLKSGSGKVYAGAAAATGKADCTLSMTDTVFVSLMQGKLNPQSAFMQGKLKLQGNLQLATKLGLLMNNNKSKL